MITNPREQKICNKYSAYDDTGHVHCFECPLNKSIGMYDFICKANSHYDRHIGEWVIDDVTETTTSYATIYPNSVEAYHQSNALSRMNCDVTKSGDNYG